jgi:hypothetical protein
MKNTAKLLIILVQLIISNFQTFAIEKETEKNPEFQPKLLTIDFADSVIYDLSNAALVGNQYSFLVSIKSNDTINALDFSFKYNQLKLQYL